MTESTTQLPTNANKCLSFSISGDWGHFRRIEGNVVKQTYYIPPRTTIAGMIAAIIGIDRNEYYDLFKEDNSAIAIEPTTKLRTINLPANTISTNSDNIKSVGSWRSIKVSLPNTGDPSPRQQHNYEVLVNPTYRIDIWLEDETTYQKLKQFLEKGKSVYPPSLGLSEYLADIEYHGEFDIKKDTTEANTTIDSTVPNMADSVIPNADTKTAFEKSPGYMTATDNGRKTTGYIEYAYNPTGNGILVNTKTTHTVDERTVMFG